MKRVLNISASDDEVKVRIRVDLELKDIFSSQERDKIIENLREELVDKLQHGNGHQFWLSSIRFK